MSGSPTPHDHAFAWNYWGLTTRWLKRCVQPLRMNLELTLLVTLSGFQAVDVTVNATSHTICIFCFKAAEMSELKTGRSHVAGMKQEEKRVNSRETRSAVPVSHCSSEEVLHANMNICISKAWSLCKKNASRAFPCQHPKVVVASLL